MGHKYTEQEINLYNTIDEILWKDWDPIGVNEFPDARDEYHSYLPQVYSLAKENCSSIEIADYLFKIEKESIELPSTIERCISIAEKIVEAKKKYLG